MSKFTTSDGVQLYYEEAGEGRPLVLVAGWTMSTEWWRRQVPELSKSMRTIAVDMRSHGRSEKTDRGHRLARYATDLRELIIGLGIEDAVACGWSSGAATIWAYVDLYGTDRLSGVILVEQTPKFLTDEKWKAGLGEDFSPSAAEAFIDSFERDPETFRREFIPSMFANRPSDQELEWMVDAVSAMPAEHAVKVVRYHLHQDYRDVLDRVDVPALVVTGAHGTSPSESGTYQTARMPHARQEVFEKSGHPPFYEEANRFNTLVQDFVRSL